MTHFFSYVRVPACIATRSGTAHQRKLKSVTKIMRRDSHKSCSAEKCSDNWVLLTADVSDFWGDSAETKLGEAFFAAVGEYLNTLESNSNKFKALKNVPSTYQDKVEARMAELARLEDGWFDGAGKKIAPAVLDGVKDWLLKEVGPLKVSEPYIYPTPKGGVQVEWDAPEHCFEVSINPDSSGLSLFGLAPKDEISSTSFEGMAEWLKSRMGES